MRKDANQLSCEEFQRQMAELVSSGVDIEDLYASFVRKLVRSFLLLAAVLIFGGESLARSMCKPHGKLGITNQSNVVTRATAMNAADIQSMSRAAVISTIRDKLRAVALGSKARARQRLWFSS